MDNCGNPFISGTWAHTAYESIHGKCQDKKETSSKRTRSQGPIMLTPETVRAIRKQLGIEIYKSDGTLA